MNFIKDIKRRYIEYPWTMMLLTVFALPMIALFVYSLVYLFRK